MAQPLRSIPVEHAPAVHAVELSPERATHDPIPLTLLELVHAVDEVSESECESIATIVHMLRSGRIRLSGSFRDEPLDDFLD